MVYYRARRENGRVVKEYAGSGLIAELTAQLDAAERIERKQQRDSERESNEESREAMSVLDEVDYLIVTELARLGLHRPKRDKWRRRR